jgi:hypothetical protein
LGIRKIIFFNKRVQIIDTKKFFLKLAIPYFIHKVQTMITKCFTKNININLSINLQKGINMINILIFIIALFVYEILLRIFGYSYKTFIQVVINAILGLVALYILKIIEIPVQINWISVIITAFFGLPGVVVITIFQIEGRIK